MAAIILTSKEPLVLTLDFAVDHSLVTLGPKGKRIFSLSTCFVLLFVLVVAQAGQRI